MLPMTLTQAFVMVVDELSCGAVFRRNKSTTAMIAPETQIAIPIVRMIFDRFIEFLLTGALCEFATVF